MPDTHPVCACGVELRPGWQFCPACGDTTPKNCAACGNPLDPAWKVCPFCGKGALSGVGAPDSGPTLAPTNSTSPEPAFTPQEGPAGPGGAWQPGELGWSLHDALLHQFQQPFKPLRVAMKEATESDSLARVIAATDPALFAHAAASGLTGVTQQRGSPFWPAAVCTALAELDGQRQELLALLDPAVDLVRSTTREVLALDLPEGFWAQVAQKAGEAATPGTGAARGSLGGATIGSAILPGVGTLIGGLLGAIFAGSSTDNKNQAVLEKYGQALDRLQAGIDGVWYQAWDRVAEAAGKLGCPLPGHSHFIEAEAAWKELWGDAASSSTPRLSRVLSLPASVGPHARCPA
jgi:hypothetical protein